MKGNGSVMKKKCTQLGTLLVSILVLSCSVCSDPNSEENTELTDVLQSNYEAPASQGVEFFRGTYDDARSLAEQENKLVFMYMHTQLQPFDIVMREVVFRSPDVGQFFNERFVNYQLDLDQEDWVNSGLDFVLKLVVDITTPMYLVLDHEGNIVGQANGGASPTQIISIISRAIGEADSTFTEMQKRYEAGERSTEFIQQYLMDAIEELAFRRLDGRDEANLTAYHDKRAKYKKIAHEYFGTKPHPELINETDVHLITYFCRDVARGDEIVDFVIDHYDEFVAVSSETAIAQFAINTTHRGISDTAQTGDDRFIEYLDSLDSYPLNQAFEHVRKLVSENVYIGPPVQIRFSWGVDYLKGKGNWDKAHDLYLQRLEKLGDTVPPREFELVARGLLESEDQPTLLKAAVEYSRRAYEKDLFDPQFASTYIFALRAAGKKYLAVQITEKYREDMSRTTAGKIILKEFDSLLASNKEKNIQTLP